MAKESLPTHLGIALAEDQRLTRDDAATNKNNRFPKILCTANGIRHVAPYFVQQTLPIGRLAEGRTLGSALAVDSNSIVKNRSLREWWPSELAAGRLLFLHNNNNNNNNNDNNDTKRPATPDDVVQRGDVLVGRYHFHEQATVAIDPTIVFRDEHYLVVNKPGGMDVLSNPDGHRVFQSLPGRMLPLVITPAHRIDHPVSGLVCCGITNGDTKRLAQTIRARETTKTYIARVRPNKLLDQQQQQLPLEITTPLGFDKSIGRCTIDHTPAGKASHTSIMSVMCTLQEDDTAVILVRPHTGRKHQIRKHLASVGLPIANDCMYNNENCKVAAASCPVFSSHNDDALVQQLYEDHFVEDCPHCVYVQNLLRSSSDVGPSVSQPIWLHSWKYEFPSLGRSFEAPPPPWAHVELWNGMKPTGETNNE